MIYVMMQFITLPVSVAKDVLGESKGCGQPTKETWWWYTEIQAAIRLKIEL